MLADLEDWLVKHEWRGWDPFDALNSPILKALTLGKRYPGIAMLQLLKRSPLNLRPLLRVPQLHNAKAMGLFLTAHAIRYQRDRNERDLERITFFADWLDQNANREYGGAGWGYPFDWPNRTFNCPAGTPTVVNTAFIGFGLLKAFEVTQRSDLLGQAESAAKFIATGLNMHNDDNGECSSYTPLDNAQIHNANLLGAALLLEVGSLQQNEKLIETGKRRLSWSLAGQAADGSWPYGTNERQSWIDSFHTGYNLDALDRSLSVTQSREIQSALERGYAFYLDNFFQQDGTVKYYHNNPYPLDAHAFAHALITLTRFQRLDPRSLPLRKRVLKQMMKRFWNKRGFFHYQQHKHYINRIAYTRWVQAWCYLGLITCNDGN